MTFKAEVKATAKAAVQEVVAVVAVIQLVVVEEEEGVQI